MNFKQENSSNRIHVDMFRFIQVPLDFECMSSSSTSLLHWIQHNKGLRGSELVEGPHYKPEGHGFDTCRTQWLCGLRLRSAAALLLGLRVRIPPGA